MTIIRNMNFSKEFLDNLKNMSTEELRTQYSDITQMDGPALTLARGLTDDQIRDEILDYMDSPSYLAQEEEEEEEFAGMGRADVIQSILLHQEDEADSAGVNTLGYTRSELNALNDEDLESIINDYVKNPPVEWEDNKDLEIPTYSAAEETDEDLTPDEGEKLSKFSGMGRRTEVTISVLKTIIREGLALEEMGILNEFELKLDAIKEAVIEESMVKVDLQLEAEYKGREVSLGKPMKGDTAKFKVYVKDKSTGNVKKVNFGSKEMEIRRDNPAARKSFRARHGCGTSRASDRTKAAYWSCKMWSTKPVSDIIGGK